MKPRLTERRKEILQVINESGKPLNAKDIFEKISSQPNLSTVYRALDFLEKEKYINSVSFSRIKFYYKGLEEEGGHFLFCGKCHEILEFNDCVVHDLKDKIQEQFNYTITGHVLCFEGVCSDCQNYLNRRAEAMH